MEKNSKSNQFVTRLKACDLPQKIKENLQAFYQNYREELKKHDFEEVVADNVFSNLLTAIDGLAKTPFQFDLYHKKVRAPFDYYAMGVEFIRPLVDKEKSSVFGLQNFDKIEQQLKRKENIILLANHQIEADPQAISILLENTHPKIGEEMIFVAGARVATDPLAVPFSMGRNLLCIYSKRYIDHPPEQKFEKQLHNKRTMEKMSELLSEGGHIIYVAPSGGRDRRNDQGVVEVAPFDPASIEMFYLMAKKSGTPAHFYPLALSTYDLLPPPKTVQIELGEERYAHYGAIHLGIGAEINMEEFPGKENPDKHERRKLRAEHIYDQVKIEYSKFNA